MSNLLQDLRYGLRLLARAPLFTAVAVLSLALGIGASSATFSLMKALLFQPWPVQNPEKLMAVYRVQPTDPDLKGFSYPDYEDYQLNDVFSGLSAFSATMLSLSGGGAAEVVSGDLVTESYFELLGLRPALGRFFGPEEANAPVAVLNHDLHRRLFQGDPAVLGKAIKLNGQSFTVVGVAPAGFRGLNLSRPAQLWIPLRTQRLIATGFMAQMDVLSLRGVSWLDVVGRLKPGVGVKEAQAALTGISRRIEQVNPETARGTRVRLVPAIQAAAGMQTRGDLVRLLQLLTATVGLQLLIACVNLAGLLLARAMVRQREVAVRLAIGASRNRLVRQLVTESVLLAILGGALGLLVATWAMGLLAPFTLPGEISVGALGLGLDARLLVFAFLLSILTGVAFGLPPALQVSRAALATGLRDRGGEVERRRARLRSSLVAGQVALSLVLLVGAGLFGRSVREALTSDLGFDPGRVLSATLNLGLQDYDEARAQRFYREVQERLAASPGVEAASWAKAAGVGDQGFELTVTPLEYDPKPGEDMQVNLNAVSPGYFETLGIPLVKGRAFESRDRQDAPGVVIVNEALARRFWPGQDPIGKSISTSGPEGPYLEIVGLARNAKYKSLDDRSMPYMYLPLDQFFGMAGLGQVKLLVRTQGDPRGIVPVVRRVIHELDPEVPVLTLPLEDQLAQFVMAQRLSAMLMTFFSVISIALCVGGIYGLMSYLVNQRRHEIGIRLALGAQRQEILGLVLRHGVAMTVIGLGLGLGATFGVTRLVASLLYGVSPGDPLTIAGASVLLGGVAFLASFVPARRAARIAPSDAFRYE